MRVDRRLLGALVLFQVVALAGACNDDDGDAPVGDAGISDGGDAGDAGGAADAAAPGDGGGGAQDAGAGATVMGTLTLPGAAAGKPYFVAVVTMPGPVFVAQTTGTTGAAATLAYSIPGVPAGTYYLLGFVDVDGSGGTASTTGDYRGWYGHTGDGNPPAAPNAVVPASGTATFDFGLVLAP
jgi:hypothetical protein